MQIDIKKLKKMTKDLKLLYVEDDEMARKSMLEMLGNFFSNVSVAVNGQDGLEKFQTTAFDLVLTDINMPRMTGLEMLSEIRKVDRGLPVLILSAYNDAELFLNALKLGSSDYILKPLEHNQFLMALQKVVEQIDLKKQIKNYQKELEEEVTLRTQELYEKLYFDDITPLSSRYSFFEDVKKYEKPTVIIIDIDEFKLFNEIYGIATGNLILEKFGEFILNFAEIRNFKAYRISADEFVLLEEYKENDLEDYQEYITSFFEELSHYKINIGNDFITLEATMGISIHQDNPLGCAKIAFEYAKKKQQKFFAYSLEIDTHEEKKDILVWKDTIKAAIEDKRVVPVYQGIVDASGKVVKYETLMRLREANSQKLITPFFFLDVAMKTKLYDSLSSTVIFSALKLAQETGVVLSVNFTFRDIQNKQFIHSIATFINAYEGLATQLVFEITESESFENYDIVKDFIKRFRAKGVRFAIDDFGSGFSNFEYILEIKPDYLKIDGSLVKNIDTDESSYILVKAIIGFSHKLGIKVIAEFVHNEKVFSLLKELHVDEYQGFYFYEPLEHLS